MLPLRALLFAIHVIIPWWSRSWLAPQQEDGEASGEKRGGGVKKEREEEEYKGKVEGRGKGEEEEEKEEEMRDEISLNFH